ncbi:MAG TPA: hypothetical protein VGK44_06485 [Casimicrobiaceae bacterium]
MHVLEDHQQRALRGKLDELRNETFHQQFFAALSAERQSRLSIFCRDRKELGEEHNVLVELVRRHGEQALEFVDLCCVGVRGIEIRRVLQLCDDRM